MPQTIQADYPGWRIWNGRTRTGEPSPTCWVASLHDPDVGVHPTVITDTPGALIAALEAQRRRIEAHTGLPLIPP